MLLMFRRNVSKDFWMDIFKLTVPLETNIKNAKAQKMNKYEHFITDIGMCLFILLKSTEEDIN